MVRISQVSRHRHTLLKTTNRLRMESRHTETMPQTRHMTVGEPLPGQQGHNRMHQQQRRGKKGGRKESQGSLCSCPRLWSTCAPAKGTWLQQHDAKEQHPDSESKCTCSAHSAQSAKDGSRVDLMNTRRTVARQGSPLFSTPPFFIFF